MEVYACQWWTATQAAIIELVQRSQACWKLDALEYVAAIECILLHQIHRWVSSIIRTEPHVSKICASSKHLFRDVPYLGWQCYACKWRAVLEHCWIDIACLIVLEVYISKRSAVLEHPRSHVAWRQYVYFFKMRAVSKAVVTPEVVYACRA